MRGHFEIAVCIDLIWRRGSSAHKLATSCKNIETFSLIEVQTVSPWSCAFCSPTPLIKVASNAKPYSKLQPTTLNGGEGAGVFY